MSRISRLLVMFAVLAFLIVPAVASAHEHREVGEYEFVVGFMNEPAYENEQNGIWVSIKNHASGEPVTDLTGTLKAQVIYGAATRDMTLEPAWGEDGVYVANFYPTAAGDYTFRFFGDINGTPVDEKFTSSPEGFNAVSPVSELQFPNQLGTVAELQQQIRTAQLFGIAGLVVGAIGLAVAVWALLSRRSRASAASRTLQEA